MNDDDDLKHAQQVWARFQTEDLNDLANDLSWLRAAKDFANSWRTCACGQLVPDELRPEYPDGERVGRPDDSELFRLGMNFSERLSQAVHWAFTSLPDKHALTVAQLKTARRIWHAIEARTANLLARKRGELK